MKRAIYLSVLCAAVLLAAGLWLLPHFYVTLLAYCGLSGMVALGLVLLTGVGGMTSFGQAAFAGMGAYATAYLTTVYAASPWLGLVAGLGMTVIIALVVGFVTLRLSGHYLPLSTIAWGLSLYYLMGNIPGLGGHTGLTGIPPLSIAGIEFDSSRKFAALIWALTLLTMLAVTNLLQSRPGRAIRALNGASLMAESFGVDVPRLKTVVFIYSVTLACVSGWLYAHLVGFVNPTPFSAHASIEYLFMVVLGGASYVWGAIVGAGVFTFVKRWLQDYLPLLVGNAGNFEQVVFGTLIIVLMQVTKGRGIMDGLDRLFQRLRPAPLRKAAAVPEANLPQAPLPVREKAKAQELLLQLSHVRKRFGGLIAVQDFSFEVRQGEIMALLGPNGAGKSTVFNMISGALPLTGGEVRFRGQLISNQAMHDIVALGIARTFQHPIFLKRMSALDNVMLGAYLRTRGGVTKASLGLNRQEEAQLRSLALTQLERVGLAEHAQRPASMLSLGQQRLLEIARALCADPTLLLLDEPAAGLRYAEKSALAQLLAKLREEGVSVLLVEHDMGFVMNLVDRIVVLNFGNKLAEGTPEEIRTDPKVLEAYLGAAT